MHVKIEFDTELNWTVEEWRDFILDGDIQPNNHDLINDDNIESLKVEVTDEQSENKV